jgi:hypothetical protein
MKSFDDLEKAFDRGLEAWQKDIFVGEAKKIGHNAAAEVKKLTPVDTGTLRRRWTSSVDQSSGAVVIWIKNNTKYGPAVNYGHRIVIAGKTRGKTKGVHFLENGLYNYKRKMLQADVMVMLQRLREAF